MRKVKKSSILLLGVLIFILGVTTYISIITVWDTNPTVDGTEETLEPIQIPKRPKTSAIYDYNLTVDNNPGSGITWADVVSEPWASGSGTAGDPYLISGDTIMFNNSDNGQYACINISNSHNVYFKISGVTVRNNASDVGIGISISNSTNGAIINVNASDNGDDGIYLVNSQNITIDDSMMRNNHHRGLLMDNVTVSTITNIQSNHNGLSGAYLINSTYNLFSLSNFTYNGYAGIGMIDSDLNNMTTSDLNYNTIAGLGAYASDGCYFTSNNIDANNGFGLVLLNDSGDCINNHIFGNTFSPHGWGSGFDNGSLNVWDNGVDSGNTWADYGGADLDDDGIGDTPYNISGEAGSQDRYPIWDDGDSIAPVITIVNPGSNRLYLHLPIFSLTIVEAEAIYNRWYTLDGGSHNATFTGTTGTISGTEWSRITGSQGSVEDVYLTFYVNDTSGNIGTATVQIRKYFLESVEHGEDSDDVYMYSLTKNQIYILLAFSFSLSLVLRIVTLRTRKQ